MRYVQYHFVLVDIIIRGKGKTNARVSTLAF